MMEALLYSLRLYFVVFVFLQHTIAAAPLSLLPDGNGRLALELFQSEGSISDEPGSCQDLPSGLYPHGADPCRAFIVCSRQRVLLASRCRPGTVFSPALQACAAPTTAANPNCNLPLSDDVMLGPGWPAQPEVGGESYGDADMAALEAWLESAYGGEGGASGSVGKKKQVRRRQVIFEPASDRMNGPMKKTFMLPPDFYWRRDS